MQTFEQYLESVERRRHNADARAEARIERREIEAEKMIGELCRNGETIYYVFPVGGKYREGDRVDLIAFLVRNNYA